MFYAALHSTATGAPRGCLWVVQIRIPLHWIRAFMQGTSGSLRTDNVAALTTLVKLQPHSSTLGIIARELALDIATSSFSPDEAIHIPGIANRAADYLSRICDPSASASPPAYLDPQRRHTCEVRTVSWWRSVPR